MRLCLPGLLQATCPSEHGLEERQPDWMSLEVYVVAGQLLRKNGPLIGAYSVKGPF
jgi:hypothetical protein